MSVHQFSVRSKVRLDPLVLFQIIDAYERRPEMSPSAVGALLGRRDEHRDIVEITNSYVLHCNEQQKDSVMEYILDTNYAREMFELNRLVYPQETILGWYDTDSQVSRSAQILHKYYASECGNWQPLHLLVDTTLRCRRMAIKLYCAVPIGVPGGTSGLLFTRLPMPQILENRGLVAVQQMPLQQQLLQLLDASQWVDVRLKQILLYIQNVLQYKCRPNSHVGRMLSSVLSSVPPMDVEDFQRLQIGNARIMLMGLTLSSMIQTQMQLDEKLSHFVPQY